MFAFMRPCGAMELRTNLLRLASRRPAWVLQIRQSKILPKMKHHRHVEEPKEHTEHKLVLVNPKDIPTYDLSRAGDV